MDRSAGADRVRRERPQGERFGEGHRSLRSLILAVPAPRDVDQTAFHAQMDRSSRDSRTTGPAGELERLHTA